MAAFYLPPNGLIVETPHLSIFSLDQLDRNPSDLLRFATFDEHHHIAFDVSGLNDAEQWNIVVEHNRSVLTLTMASFCQTRIWSWLEKRRRSGEGEGA